MTAAIVYCPSCGAHHAVSLPFDAAQCGPRAVPRGLFARLLAWFDCSLPRDTVDDIDPN